MTKHQAPPPCEVCGEVFTADEYGCSADYHTPNNKRCLRRQLAATRKADSHAWTAPPRNEHGVVTGEESGR